MKRVIILDEQLSLHQALIFSLERMSKPCHVTEKPQSRVSRGLNTHLSGTTHWLLPELINEAFLTEIFTICLVAGTVSKSIIQVSKNKYLKLSPRWWNLQTSVITLDLCVNRFSIHFSVQMKTWDITNISLVSIFILDRLPKWYLFL